MNFIRDSESGTTYILQGSFPVSTDDECLTIRNGIILQATDSVLSPQVTFENDNPVEDVKVSSPVVASVEDLIETIVSYSCKLCSFVSEDKGEAANHVRFTHLMEINWKLKEEVKENDVDYEEPTGESESANGNTQTVYMCGGCSSPFVTMAQCKAHMNQHHKNGFTSPKKKETKEIEVKNVEPQEEIITPIEEEKQMDYSCPDLTKEKSIKCSVEGCQIKFSSDELMQKHQECHSPDSSSFCCTRCHLKFKNWRLLASHFWKVHLTDMDLFKCSACKYRSPSRVHLGKHFKMLHCAGAGEFPCLHCLKLFEDKTDLSEHLAAKHSEDYPPPTDLIKKKLIDCQECGKQLSDIRSLKKHIKCIHGQLRPYVCQVCGFSSKTRDTLTLHTRQHTGEKPFSCDSCPFKSRDHNTLRKHKMRHLGVRPYSCKHCSYSATQSQTLKLHMMKFHPDKDGVYTCSHCTFSTLSQVLFNNHQKVHHKEGRSKNSSESSQERNFGSMFPSSKTKEIVRVYPAGVEDEESSSQCYFDTDHIDTGGITIPAEETKTEVVKDVQSQ